MSILGVSAGFHDAAVSVVDRSGNILFAGHSERYSKIKNDPNVCPALLADVITKVNHISYYEKPWLKQLRQWYSGQGIEWNKMVTESILRTQLGDWINQQIPGVNIFQETFFEDDIPKISSHRHHLSHAAAGFQTSPYQEATVVVCDAIGEWDTASIYHAYYDDHGCARYKKLWSQKYPHSLGMFYSAFTKRVGLRPMDEEYILMGMSAWGKSTCFNRIYDEQIENIAELKFKNNLHLGVNDSYLDSATNEDIAASVQEITEWAVCRLIERARMLGKSENLVYMGGVALNCLANRLIGKYYSNIWIMPNPGDAGSSLGAAALSYGKKLNWQDAYLGHIIPGPYPVNDLLEELLSTKIVGVASGAAEFGPRALGNRSLLADPRGADIKDRVNEIKRRQKFRPFAPVILAEMVNDYFDMPPGWVASDYMQVVAKCREPDLFPAVCHVDGTSRVQTVPKNSRSGIRQLLEQWYVITGCPMLLNTSLNIRGEPMVNDRADADRFEQHYNIKVKS
jgi:carbamoyltransferase